MKKLVCLALALIMVLALAACGGSGTVSSTSTTTVTSDGQTTTIKTTETTTEEPDSTIQNVIDEVSKAAGAEGITGESLEKAVSELVEGSDTLSVINSGKLVIGITDFAPMDYKNDKDEWIGFDADMAKLFAESLGVTPEFIEINWDNKAMELQTKAIDCVWNGMTLTAEVKNLMATSQPYCNNGQVVVVPKDKADQYQTADSLKGLSFAVENGSAGAEVLDELGIAYTAMDTQAKALMEVASGASEACVIDLLMAGAMIGEGTSYPNLVYTVQLNNEEYGVGFRKDSDLPEIFNTFWKEAYASGIVKDTATRYGVQESIIEVK